MATDPVEDKGRVRGAPQATPTAAPEASIRRIRYALLAIVVAVLSLVFGVPRAPAPAPSPESPDEAFVDRVGLVSPAFARQWAGALLNDPRAQVVVYIDARPPEGALAQWTSRTASAWRVGTERDDTGLVLFVFTAPRIARVEVGYGLEGTLTDARVRQLLETHLEPAFSVGAYEQGIDRLLFAIREDLGGDAAIAAAEIARLREPTAGMLTFVADGLRRIPLAARGTWSAFAEGDAGERLAIVVVAAVFMAIVLLALAMAGIVARSIATIPARWRDTRAGAAPDARAPAARIPPLLRVGSVVFPIVMGLATIGICIGLLGIVLHIGPEFFGRRGDFSGAGAAVVWERAR